MNTNAMPSNDDDHGAAESAERMQPASTPNVLDLRERVILTRAAYRRGEVGFEAMHRAADEYIDAMAEKAKRLWPGRRFRKPSRSYILRAL